MIATHLLIATGFFVGASSLVPLGDRASVSITAPLALGTFNSARNAATAAGVVNVRITQSMA